MTKINRDRHTPSPPNKKVELKDLKHKHHTALKHQSMMEFAARKTAHTVNTSRLNQSIPVTIADPVQLPEGIIGNDYDFSVHRVRRSGRAKPLPNNFKMLILFLAVTAAAAATNTTMPLVSVAISSYPAKIPPHPKATALPQYHKTTEVANKVSEPSEQPKLFTKNDLDEFHATELKPGFGRGPINPLSPLEVGLHKLSGQIAEIKLPDVSEKFTDMGGFVNNTAVLTTKDSAETTQLRLKMVAQAKQSIEISGNFGGGKAFLQLIEAIDSQMEKEPELKVNLLFSVDFIKE